MSVTMLPVTGETLLSATLWFLGFVLALFAGSIVLPGLRRVGFPMRNGERKTYKLSGLVLFLTTHVVVAAATVLWDLSLTPLLTHFWSLFIVANVFAVAFTLVLFVMGRRKLGDAVERGDSKLPPLLHDLWFGPELNPTIAGVDIKMFAYHPSLIGLGLVNAGFAYAQFETYGTVTTEMWMYQLFWWGYLMTHYVKEAFMLSTWDIIAEHFGFMLVWGDLVYVPFLYSLVGWFVVDRGWSGGVHTPMPLVLVVALCGFYALSLWIFRGSNWQKDKFKRDPQARIWGKPAQTLGGKLLVSGWWGIGRKINYTGEIGVYLCFALTSGFGSPFPYILPLTLVVLLTQRAGRDDKKCRRKYGKLWEEYCEKARFRIVPFVY